MTGCWPGLLKRAPPNFRGNGGRSVSHNRPFSRRFQRPILTVIFRTICPVIPGVNPRHNGRNIRIKLRGRFHHGFSVSQTCLESVCKTSIRSPYCRRPTISDKRATPRRIAVAWSIRLNLNSFSGIESRAMTVHVGTHAQSWDRLRGNRMGVASTHVLGRDAAGNATNSDQLRSSWRTSFGSCPT